MLAWVVIYRRQHRLAHKPKAIRLFRSGLIHSFPSFLTSLHHYIITSLLPVFRIFFQVPYPATPLFATLAKTAGVCTNNSHSGTHQSRVQFSSLAGLSLTPIPHSHTLSPFLSCSCALFCAFLHSARTQLFSFQALPHSLLKIPGVGCPSLFVPFGQEASHPR